MADDRATTPAQGRWSLSALVGLILAVGFVLPTGIFGIPLGLVGILRTKRGRRGRKAAVWAAALGCLSLYLTLNPVGCTFYQPPILRPDRSLQSFLNKVAERQYDEALHQGIVVDGMDADEFADWADAFNDGMGPGTVVVAESRFYWVDPGSAYLVRFEKGGWRRIQVGAPDWHFAREKGYVLFGGKADITSPEGWTRERRMRRLFESVTSSPAPPVADDLQQR